MLIVLGYNIRKLFKYYSGNLKTEFWKAPEDLNEEKFKKPSSKRLNNKVNKRERNLSTKKRKENININKRDCEVPNLRVRFFHSPL